MKTAKNWDFEDLEIGQMVAPTYIPCKVVDRVTDEYGNLEGYIVAPVARTFVNGDLCAEDLPAEWQDDGDESD